MNLSPTASLIVTMLGVLLGLCAVNSVALVYLFLRRRKAAPDAPAVFVPLDIPETSEAIQTRQGEQHELITALGVVEKQLAQAIADKRPVDALIAQKAQIQKDVARINVEVATSQQARNLTTFMTRMDELGTRILAAQDTIGQKIGGLEKQNLLFQSEFRNLLEAVNDFSARLELVEKSSTELRDLVTTLALELLELRQRTAADALTAAEWHAMISTMRWLHAHTAALSAVMGVPPPEAAEGGNE